MLPDRVSNRGPLAFESDALTTAPRASEKINIKSNQILEPRSEAMAYSTCIYFNK